MCVSNLKAKCCMSETFSWYVRDGVDLKECYSAVQYSVKWNAARFLSLFFFNFLSANKGEPSFVGAPISPLRLFCTSLWLGSKHIVGVRGVKSFAVVIMGSPLQSNHELLKTALRSAPQQCQLTSTLLWEVAGKRPTACKPEWARSCVSVCGTCLRQHRGFYGAVQNEIR